MSLSMYFGLPGCGKTTLLTYLAKKGVKNRKYQNVYSNVRLSVPGVTYIDNSCIGKYDLRNGLLLIDEASIFADNRGYKDFSKALTQFFLLHRHYNLDICTFQQQADGVDKKLRCITDRMYYVYKSKILGWLFTSYYRIPYGIIIPDPKKDGTEKLGDIVQGYCKPPFLVRFLSHKIFRPRYYKYFDSWEAPELLKLPSRYAPYQSSKKSKKKRKTRYTGSIVDDAPIDEDTIA